MAVVRVSRLVGYWLGLNIGKVNPRRYPLGGDHQPHGPGITICHADKQPWPCDWELRARTRWGDDWRRHNDDWLAGRWP